MYIDKDIANLHENDPVARKMLSHVIRGTLRLQPRLKHQHIRWLPSRKSALAGRRANCYEDHPT